MKTILLPEKLQSFDYYVNKLPLYLQNSYGFKEHFKIWYDLLMSETSKTNCGIVPAGEILLQLMNIFDQDYLKTLSALEGIDSSQSVYGSTCDLLDKVGLLFGLKRKFSVQYKLSENGDNLITKQLDLNNYEFLLLIKTQIIKNYCEGSYEQIITYYNDVGLKILPVTFTSPATCLLLFQRVSQSEYQYSTQLEDLFLAGLLHIESMGITYQKAIVDFDTLLIWDSDTIGWDTGEWSI